MYPRCNVGDYFENVISIRDEQIQYALRDVDRYSDVDVHETRLYDEEYRLTGMQRVRFPFTFVLKKTSS